MDTLYTQVLEGRGSAIVRLQSADVKFLRACSFLFMRFRPGAERPGCSPRCQGRLYPPLVDMNETGLIGVKMVQDGSGMLFPDTFVFVTLGAETDNEVFSHILLTTSRFFRDTQA